MKDAWKAFSDAVKVTQRSLRRGEVGPGGDAGGSIGGQISANVCVIDRQILLIYGVQKNSIHLISIDDNNKSIRWAARAHACMHSCMYVCFVYVSLYLRPAVHRAPWSQSCMYMHACACASSCIHTFAHIYITSVSARAGGLIYCGLASHWQLTTEAPRTRRQPPEPAAAEFTFNVEVRLHSTV